MSAVSTERVVDLAQLNVAVTPTGMFVSKSVQKLIAVGEATGIVLSDEVLARMGVKCGDVLLLEETASGVQLTPYRAGIADQLGLADDLMRENHVVLGRLAQ